MNNDKFKTKLAIIIFNAIEDLNRSLCNNWKNQWMPCVIIGPELLYRQRKKHVQDITIDSEQGTLSGTRGVRNSRNESGPVHYKIYLDSDKASKKKFPKRRMNTYHWERFIMGHLKIIIRRYLQNV